MKTKEDLKTIPGSYGDSHLYYVIGDAENCQIGIRMMVNNGDGYSKHFKDQSLMIRIRFQFDGFQNHKELFPNLSPDTKSTNHSSVTKKLSIAIPVEITDVAQVFSELDLWTESYFIEYVLKVLKERVFSVPSAVMFLSYDELKTFIIQWKNELLMDVAKKLVVEHQEHIGV